MRFRAWSLVLLAFSTGITSAPLVPLTSYTESIELSGDAQSVDVYRPGAGSPAGVAIIAHGFTRSRTRHVDLGRALADAGVIAVIPDLPSVMNLWGNGDAIVELAQKLEAGALGLPPVARAHLVLIGTSAGGLATVLAAAKLPGVAGWIGLDPVDRTGTGTVAAAQSMSPAVVLLANASPCNLFASGRSMATAAPHLLRAKVIEGASHCDFEDPTNIVCMAFCGQLSTPAMQLRIRGETVATTLEMLEPAGAPPTAVPEDAPPTDN